jgi:hypothetical protein
VSFTDVNAHTKKIIINKHEKSMGKFSVTTPDRNTMNLEKTFSLAGAGSVLSPEKKNKATNKNSFTEEIETLRKNHKLGLRKNIKDFEEKVSVGKKEILNISENIENTQIISVPAINNEAIQMINALVHTQNHIVQELTEVFDKRLEKFDDIIMDLIRCKTENERLKQKVDNLTRDNYKCKKELESFKSIIPGVYIKKELDKTRF